MSLINKVLYNIDQRNDTTPTQKETARKNIGAYEDKTTAGGGTGIPKSDLASGVQASLGKADSALQAAVEYVTTSSTWQTLETAYNAGKTLILKVENGSNWFDEYRITAVNKSSGSDRFIFCGFPTAVNLDSGSVKSLEVTEWICYLDGSTTRWINSPTVNGVELTTKDYVAQAVANKQDSLGYGTSGQYLKSNGANNAPSWDDPSNMTAGGITNASYNSGYSGTVSNWSRCIKIDLKSERAAASIRCLLLQATDSNAVGFVDIIIKSKEDNSWDGVSYVTRSELSASNLGKVGYYQTGATVYLGISVGAFGSIAIPMLMGKTGNIDITFGDFTSIMTSEPSSTMLPSFINTHAPINTAVGSTSTPVHVASNGQVQECDPSQMSVGTTQNVATQGAASNSISRHVWFSDSTTETKRAHDDNLKYTPDTNTISANISGSATSIGGKKIVVGSLGTDSSTIYFLTGA